MLTLILVSCFFVYSAQIYSGQVKWKAQMLWIQIGLALYLIFAFTDYRKLLVHAHWIYILTLGALLLTLTPFGKEMNHTRRWVNLYFYYLQPVEFAKLGTLIMAASLLTRTKIESLRDSLQVVIKVCLSGMATFLVVFLQPDLGSALVFPPIILVLLYVSHLSKRFFLAIFGICVLMMLLVGVDMYAYYGSLKGDRPAEKRWSLVPLKDYQRNRILSFIAPDLLDPNGIGVNWNLKQSLISVGSGGVNGKGWMEGTQAKLGYLPQSVAHNDFIFSVFAEEMGFAGSISMLLLYAILIFKGMHTAQQSRDRFGMLIAVGVSTVFMVHVFINIGMTLGIMPITGIPLPFMSYGGSFLMSCCIMQGLVQSVYKHGKH